MKKSILEKDEQKKKCGKVVNIPDKTDRAKSQEAGGGGESGGKSSPRKGAKKKTLDSETQEALHKGAKKALRQAVKAKVKKEKEKIAEVLVNKVKSGDMRGAVMVLSLMEHGNKEGKDGRKKHDGLKLIDLLESEPEWEDKEAEAALAGVGAKVSEAANQQGSKLTG